MMDVETIFDSDREEYEFMQEKKEQPMKEQIEEMAKILKDYTKKNHIMASHVILEDYAEQLYNAGYHKQKEGEWKQQHGSYEDQIMCSVCGASFNIIENCTEQFDFCPNCGAHMRGGKNE